MTRYLVTVGITVLLLFGMVLASIHVINARGYVYDSSDTVTVLQVIR